MDYDFIDETRPRFQVQSGPGNANDQVRRIDPKQAVTCAAIAFVLLSFCWTLTGLLQFFLLWLALSVLVGPFAPLSVTGGNCSVGIGEIVAFEAEDFSSIEAEKKKRTIRQPGYTKKVDLVHLERASAESKDGDLAIVSGTAGNRYGGELGDWNLADMEYLRKQMVKHPRGKLQRWELIAEAFNGKYTIESVVRMAKGLEQKRTEDDDFSKFLAQRKHSERNISSPLSVRWESDDVNGLDNPNNSQVEVEKGKSDNGPDVHKSDWTESEDKALLTALKALPKETSSRWDRVAAAVPGRTKTQCFKRFTALRQHFRNTKADMKEIVELQ